MSRNAEPQEVVVCDACRTIPVSHLGLDVAEPLVGWSAFFRERGVEVTPDDLGRLSIERRVLGELLHEFREVEARQAGRPRVDSGPVPRGIPRPAGADEAMTALEVMRGVDADAERDDPGRRLSPHEEFLQQRLGPPRKVEVEEEEK
jgi:hypothetical protein